MLYNFHTNILFCISLFYREIIQSNTSQIATKDAPGTNVCTENNEVSALSLKPDKQIRNRNVEHHYTLPTLYKQKKRIAVNRKNATLERVSTKKSSKTLLKEVQNEQNENDPTKMHYHNRNEMPKYLFGERARQDYSKSSKSDEIYLNKSGWVQVNQRETNESPTYGDISFQKYNNNSTKNNNTSKLEALISRNENRKNVDAKLINRVNRVDPNISALLSERPGFLPIKRFDDAESPPPITPIISPPPAFQDNNGLLQTDENMDTPNINNSVTGTEKPNNKGMVFSRSFEYQTSKPYEYNQTFSKSFDYEFLSPSKEERKSEKDNTFNNLTGVSPSYLSKKPAEVTIVTTNAATTNSPRQVVSTYQQYLEPNIYSEPVRKNRTRSVLPTRHEIQEPAAERSRRGQFGKQDSSPSSGSQKGFRHQHGATSKRLNSCDSGARSGN